MIYVQTEQGLAQVSPSFTKDKIIAALGYTPADNMSFFEDESGALVIGDERGYAIARIDKDGLTTTKISTNAIALNGEDLAAKLQSLKNAIDGIEIPEYLIKVEYHCRYSSNLCKLHPFMLRYRIRNQQSHIEYIYWSCIANQGKRV